jgi:hypothetical protein
VWRTVGKSLENLLLLAELSEPCTVGPNAAHFESGRDILETKKISQERLKKDEKIKTRDEKI